MSGASESQGGSVIPNGQPPQWNYPGKLKPHHNSSITSNGTPTPPANSYAGSLSSQSSRDPSPIPAPGVLSSRASPDNVPLVRESPNQSCSQYIVNTSVQRTAGARSSHSSSASSYSNPDLSPARVPPSEPDAMSAYSQLDSATRLPPAGGPSYSGSNLSASPISVGTSRPPSIGASNLSGLPKSMGASNLSGPPTSAGTSNILGPPQKGPLVSMGASGPPTSEVGTFNFSEPQNMGPPSTAASNLSGPSASSGPSKLSGPPHMAPPTSIGASHFSGSPQMGLPASLGASDISGPSQMGPSTNMGASNIPGPSQMEPPTSIGASNILGPSQMGPPTSMGASNNAGPSQMGPPTIIGASSISGPSQMGPPTNMGASNNAGPSQMGPPTIIGASSVSGPSQMGPPTSLGASNIPGPSQMGPPTIIGASSVSAPSQMGPPTSLGASNIPGPSQMGPPTSMGASNISGPSQMGPPTSYGASNISGPSQMKPPTTMGGSNISGPPTSRGAPNISGPSQMGPPTSTGALNISGPLQMGPPTRMVASNISGPSQMGHPTIMGGSNISGPSPMGPPTSLEASDISGPSQMGPPSMGVSNISGPQILRPSASMGSSNVYGRPISEGAPPQMGPPVSAGTSNFAGPPQTRPSSMGASNLYGPPQMGLTTAIGGTNPPSMGVSNLSGSSQVAPLQMGHSTSIGGPSLSNPPVLGPTTGTATANLIASPQMGPPTNMGASNFSGPLQMGPPTSMGASRLSGPPQMGPPTSMGASNLSGPAQMGPPTSLGASNLSGPQMGPPTSMGASHISGPPQMGPPTSMGASNLSGPPQMGPSTSMGASNLSGPPQIGLPTSMGASNLSGPPKMGPPTSMGASNLSGPPQMGPPTSMGASNLSGPPQMGPPTSMGVSNLSGPPQMGPPTSMGASNLSGSQMGLPRSMGSSNFSGPHQMGPPLSNRMGPQQMGPPTSMGGHSSFGPRAGVVPPQLRPPTSMGSSSFAGPPTGPPPVGPPRSMAPSYPAGTMDPQRNMVVPPPPPGASLPPQGYMANRQGGIPPTRPSQYPSAPTQSGSMAQDHRQNYQQFGGATDALSSQFSNMSVARTGFNKLWGMDSVDLLQCRNVLPAEKVEPPKIRLHQEFLDSVNCSPDIFRCTLTKIPENNSLLQKSRLPLGILIHPFKDLNHLPVIQCSTIVRCRSCRTYINPFVYFVDHKRWKCNLCFRVNELPEEFQYDPVSKTYGDPTRRPEIKSSTIEFIAPSEYMLRPPQPAVYLFLLDVSRLGVECGYLNLFCDTLLEELDKLPGDGRTQIGFITYDSCVHFYNLAEGLSQPQQMIVVDTDEVFLPCPDNLLVNLAESRELVIDLLKKIPTMFLDSHDTKSSLGPALQAAYKLMAPTGGRVTVFQSCLPNHGPGALVAREDPSQRAGKDAPHLNPVTDFYKRLALDCSGQQVAVDLFIVNSQYCDIATISGISRFSGGCIHHFPLFKASNAVLADSLERCFRRYLTRKIGFEAVMRIRCSRGLAIHTFHGNFFVRSTDLLSLPNVNPDSGFGMQVSVEESLSDIQNICFQAALLYTSSKGERRIRVHTLCLPVAATLSDILYSADQQCIVGLLAKMAVDRSLQSSLSDARDAFINVAIDVLSVYKLVENSGNSAGLLAPMNLRLLPMYILALLKYVAFRTGQSTRLDDRLFAMCQMKTLPLSSLIQAIYPDLYPVHCLDDQNCEQLEVDGTFIPQPPRLHLSAEKLDSHGAFLMDAGEHMMMHIGHGISNEFCSSVLGVPAFSHIPEEMYELPEIESPESLRLRNFVNYLQSEKPYPTMLQVIRDDSNLRGKFIERLIEDRSEAALSYYEFLQHLKANIK